MKSCDHLNLGCGINTPKGWLNVDGSWQILLARRPWLKRILVASRLLPARQAQIPWSPDVMRLNLIRTLPFADGAFQVVYSSHLLEHLYYDHALNLLKECHRVLAPDGVCRVVVPDLEAIMVKYLAAKEQRDPEAANQFMGRLMMQAKCPKPGLLGLFYRLTEFHSHKWMYDAESLRAFFEEAGFSEARRANYLESRIQRIEEVEDAGRICQGEGVVVEGIKSK